VCSSARAAVCGSAHSSVRAVLPAVCSSVQQCAAVVYGNARSSAAVRAAVCGKCSRHFVAVCDCDINVLRM
jgi:hypothetical protein